MNNRLLSTVFQLVDSFLWWMWKKRQPYGESCGNLIAKGWRWIFFFFLFCLGFNQAGASSGDDAALPLFERLKLLKMRSDDPQALHPPEGNFAPLFRLCLSIFFFYRLSSPSPFFFPPRWKLDTVRFDGDMVTEFSTCFQSFWFIFSDLSFFVRLQSFKSVHNLARKPKLGKTR